MCKSVQDKEFKVYAKALKTFSKLKFKGNNDALNSYAEIKNCMLSVGNFQPEPFNDNTFKVKFMSEVLGCFDGAYKIEDLIKMFECGSNISLNRVDGSDNYKCSAEGLEFIIHSMNYGDYVMDRPFDSYKEFLYSSCIGIDDFNFLCKALGKDPTREEFMCVCISNNAYVGCDGHRLHLYGFTTLKLDNSAPEPCYCFIPPDVIKIINAVTQKNGILSIMWNKGYARISTGQFLIEYSFDEKMTFPDFSRVVPTTSIRNEYVVEADKIINSLKRIDVPKTCCVRVDLANNNAVFTSYVKDSIQSVECEIDTHDNNVVFGVNKFLLIDGLSGFNNPFLYICDCDSPIAIMEDKSTRIAVIMPMQP